mgnify:CR=1 FL=1
MSYKGELTNVNLEAHIKGYEAGQGDLPLSSNPYNPEGSMGSVAFGHWSDGYSHAKSGTSCKDCPKSS